MGHAGRWGLLHEAQYFTELLENAVDRREGYFRRAWEALADCPHTFVDPDNGLEIKSARRSSRDSARFLYRVEVEEAYGRGNSLVIYHHRPRVEREGFTQRLVGECVSRLGGPLVNTPRRTYCFCSSLGRNIAIGSAKRTH